MISKIVPNLEAALAGIQDGAVVLIGGFGGAGQPHELIDGLIAQGAKELTIVCNNAGSGDTGIAAAGKHAQGRCRRSDHFAHVEEKTQRRR
jgi:3-oxoadipate CoA-transferase alpha subunit